MTYAAHYPVGYPALLAAGYGLFGTSPAVAREIDALLGTVAAVAAYELAKQRDASEARARGGPARRAAPGLVPYTPAIMTEGVTASLLVIAAWLASRERTRRCWGSRLGVMTLVRPQMIVLAPLLGLASAERSASCALCS